MKKLKSNIIEEIISLYKGGESLLKIAKKFEISKATVSTYINNAGKCIFVCSNCHREIHYGLLKA